MLNELVDLFKESPNLKIQIIGHTDNIGDRKYNLQLSKERSKAVYDYLCSQKVLASQLSYKGFGDSKPCADNGTAKGQALNRRVEFIIIQK